MLVLVRVGHLSTPGQSADVRAAADVDEDLRRVKQLVAHSDLVSGRFEAGMAVETVQSSVPRTSASRPSRGCADHAVLPRLDPLHVHRRPRRSSVTPKSAARRARCAA